MRLWKCTAEVEVTVYAVSERQPSYSQVCDYARQELDNRYAHETFDCYDAVEVTDGGHKPADGWDRGACVYSDDEDEVTLGQALDALAAEEER